MPKPLRSLLALCLILMLVAAKRGNDDAGDNPPPKKDTSSLQGKPAPDFTLPVLGDEEKTVQLSAQQGNAIAIVYWGSFCPGCKKLLPVVQRWNDDARLAAKGLRIVTVNSGRDRDDRAKQFIEDNKYTFAVLKDAQGEFHDSYLVRGTPTVVIVGRDGNVRDVSIGYGDGVDARIKQSIDRSLAEKPPKKKKGS